MLGPCFELYFPQLFSCLRSLLCAQTTAADAAILVRKALRQRRHGRGRVLAELAQRGRGRAAHVAVGVLEALDQRRDGRRRVLAEVA